MCADDVYWFFLFTLDVQNSLVLSTPSIKILCKFHCLFIKLLQIPGHCIVDSRGLCALMKYEM